MSIAFCGRCLGANEEAAETCVHCGAPMVPAAGGYLERLIAALEHPAPGVAARTAFFLGEKGDARAVPALVAAVERRREMEFQEAAAAALGKLGDPLAVPALVGLLRCSWLPVRVNAADALAAIGGSEARSALLRAAEEDPSPALRERARKLIEAWPSGSATIARGV